MSFSSELQLSLKKKKKDFSSRYTGHSTELAEPKPKF